MAEAAPKKNLNTTQTVKPTVTDNELRRQIAAAEKAMTRYKKVDVSIPSAFAKVFGDTLPVQVRGVKVVLPVDGSTHKIPEPLAEQVKYAIEKAKF